MDNTSTAKTSQTDNAASEAVRRSDSSYHQKKSGGLRRILWYLWITGLGIVVFFMITPFKWIPDLWIAWISEIGNIMQAFAPGDKFTGSALVRICTFAVLTFYPVFSFRSIGKGFLVSICMGPFFFILEIGQLFIEDRTFAIYDLLVGNIGILFGIAVGCMFRFLMDYRRKTKTS